jgi:hypothetical protein
MMRWPTSFGRFCYEFVIGDTPELAIGVALVIVGSWVLSRAVGPAAFWFIPLAVIGLMIVSLWRGASTHQS